MGKETETEEIQLPDTQPFANEQQQHRLHIAASKMAVCGRTCQEEESDADLQRRIATDVPREGGEAVQVYQELHEAAGQEEKNPTSGPV
jgi:hypothetical protein